MGFAAFFLNKEQDENCFFSERVKTENCRLKKGGTDRKWISIIKSDVNSSVKT